jgi:uncharacterized membrane protein YedE/YeeE
MTLGELIINAGLGIAFGFLLHHGNVADPSVIVAQMQWKNLTMLKMFMSAVSGSFLAHIVASRIDRRRFDAARQSNQNTRSYASTLIGSALLGAGMSVVGSCPGTIAAQLGSGAGLTAIKVLAGGLLGGLVYALAEPQLRSFVSSGPRPSAGAGEKLDTKFSIPYWLLAAGGAAACAGVVAAAELYVPWWRDAGLSRAPFGVLDLLRGATPLRAFFEAPAIPPYLAGALIGLSQLPAVLLLGKAIGSSSSFVTVDAGCCSLFAPSFVDNNRVLSSKRRGYGQVAYMTAAVLGAFLATHANGVEISLGDTSTLRALLGGFLVIFGARLNDGCTSGGISSFSQLTTSSLVSIAGIFGGGMLTAYFL